MCIDRAAEMSGNHTADTLPATGIHPAVIAMMLGAAAYIVITFWLTFIGGEASLILTLVTLHLAMLLGLLAACGFYTRNVQLRRASARSFPEFLDGEVDLETGQISGRAALCQLATLTGSIALGTTSMLAAFVALKPA
jgi:hypothetical protein